MSWRFSTTLVGAISAVIMIVNLLVVFHTKKRHVTKFWTPLMISMIMGIVWISTQAVAVFTPQDHLFGLGCISYSAMYLALTLLTYFSALLTEERWLINLSIVISVGIAIYILLALPIGMVFEARAYINSFGYLVIKDAHPRWIPDIVNLILLALVVAVGLHHRRDEKSTLLQRARNVLRFSVFLPIIVSATLELGILDATLHIEHPPITMLVVALASTMLPSVYRTIISLDQTTASLKAWEVNPMPTLVLDTGVILHTNPAAQKTFGEELEDLGQRLAYPEEHQNTITLNGRTYEILASEIEENLRLIMLKDITDQLVLREIRHYCRESILKELGGRIADIIAQFEYGEFKGQPQRWETIKPLLRRVADTLKDMDLVARLISGEKIPTNKERIRLSQMAKEAMEFYGPALEKHRISATINIPTDIFVVADRHLLARILRSIMGKILESAGYGGDISIRARRSDDIVMLECTITSGKNPDNRHIQVGIEAKIIRELLGGDIRVEFDYRRKTSKITITLPRG